MAARFLLALAILAGSLWALVPSSALACSCAQTELEELVAMAEFVVLGTVVQIVQIADQDPRRLPLYDVSVDADDYFKGAGPNRFQVQDDSLQGSACSPFAPDSVGHQHLLFLTVYQESDLRTSVCAGSGRVTDSEYWLERIEEVRQIASAQKLPGETPALIPATASDSGSIPLLPIAVGIGAIAALALGGALLFGVRRLAGR